jgi:hypothetical protein
LDIDSARIICMEMGSVTLQTKLKLLAEQAQLSTQNVELLNHALSVFEHCRINRNRYAHALPMSRTAELPDGGVEVTFGLLAGIKRGTITATEITDSLSEIREVAEEISALQNFLISLRGRLRREPKSELAPSFDIPPVPRIRGTPTKRTPRQRKRRPRPSRP